ncbi:hypothetical protein niasHT_003104 [Heterodera trifolii]|uniref:Uncharacterized protein n=1 Tax=Heterodera trifolii TaxID=157864 RepID=A0ABD2M4Y8_9BILA
MYRFPSTFSQFFILLFFLLICSFLTTNALKCWSGSNMTVSLFNVSTKVEEEQCAVEVTNCHRKYCKYGNGSAYYSLGCGGMDACESGPVAMLCRASGQLACTNCTGELCNGAGANQRFLGGTFAATLLAIFIALFVLQSK